MKDAEEERGEIAQQQQDRDEIRERHPTLEDLWLMPKHLDLVFSLVELAVLALATFLFGEITKDGELVWLEGVLLILLYVMMAGTVFVFGS